VRVGRPRAERLVAGGRRRADPARLDDLDAQIRAAEARIGALLPVTDYQILTITPGWSVIQAAALGPRTRWAPAAKIYRAARLALIQYESAGRRNDGGISRDGSVHQRRALIELGIGLWQCEPASRAYGPTLRSAASPAASSPVPWPTAPTRSPSRWCSTRARSTS
jgi:transposase